jgi:hypothetical protein
MSLHPLEPIPAVRRLDTTRPDLFAVEIAGHVSEADIENLYGLLEGAYLIHPQIDILMRFVDHDGVDWGEVPSDTVEQGRAHAARHVRRCAAIGDSSVAKRFLRIFAPAESDDARRFSAEEEAEAWAWLDASETTGEEG